MLESVFLLLQAESVKTRIATSKTEIIFLILTSPINKKVCATEVAHTKKCTTSICYHTKNHSHIIP